MLCYWQKSGHLLGVPLAGGRIRNPRPYIPTYRVCARGRPDPGAGRAAGGQRYEEA